MVSRRDIKQEPASHLRDPSPDILLGTSLGQPTSLATPAGNNAWREWSQGYCEDIIESMKNAKVSDD